MNTQEFIDQFRTLIQKGLQFPKEVTDSIEQAFHKIEKEQKDAKYKQSFRPPEEVAKVARKGLELREKFERGGTSVGLRRARQLSLRENVSLKTIERMKAFFDRHEENKDTDPKEGNGQIAWMLWGGDAGRRWVETILSRDEKRVEKQLSYIGEEGKRFVYYSSGSHMHGMYRNDLRTFSDGPHTHFFVLETINGELIPVEVHDGSHEHGFSEQDAEYVEPDGSAHKHVLRIPFNMTLMNGETVKAAEVFVTDEGGEHSHRASDLSFTHKDGDHKHTIDIKGNILKSVTLSEFLQLLGPFDMYENSMVLEGKDIIAKGSTEALNVTEDVEVELPEDLAEIAKSNDIDTTVSKELAVSKSDVVGFFFPDEITDEHRDFVSELGFDEQSQDGQVIVVAKSDTFLDDEYRVARMDDIGVILGTRINKEGEGEIQTIIFPKDKFTQKQAEDFIKRNNFKKIKVDETSTSFRFRQQDPDQFKQMRTIELPDSHGAKAVVGIKKESDDEPTQYRVQVMKEDLTRRIVTAVVLEPETVDGQKDIISADEIERSAYYYLTKSRVAAERHKRLAKAELVESYIAPVDFQMDGHNGKQKVKKGSWVVSFRILSDSLWKKIEKGEYNGVSVGGFSFSEPVT